MSAPPGAEPRPIRRFFREYVTPYWALQIEIGVCIVVGVLLMVVDPLLLRVIIDRALGDGDRGLLIALGLVLVGVLVFRVAFRLLSVWLYSYSGLRILFDLRQKAFEHVERLSPYFFRGERFGDVLARLTSDVDILQRAAAHTIVNAVQDVLTIVVILATLAWLDLELTVVLAVSIPLLVFVLARINERLRAEAVRAREAVSGLYSFLEERLTAMRLVQEFRREKAEAKAHVRVSRPWIASNLRLSVLGGLQVSLADLMTTGSFVLVFVLGGLRTLEGAMSLGSLVAYYSLAGRLFKPVSGLVDTNIDLATARGALLRVFALLDREPDIADPAEPRSVAEPRGAVRLEGVGLNWGSERRVLHDVDVAIEPGETVAIVGPSGGGKSTLAALVARYLDPGAGRVAIDGVDVRDWALRDLRRTVGLVSQETLLFHDTLAANLRLADSDASDEELLDVLRAMEMTDFLESRTDGLETLVGEQGLQLSGGERQRLALARALLGDPTIYILDEATSALDARTERRVLERFFERARGHTVLTIAHRLTSVQGVDRILVLADGRLVEQGTHEELLGLGGLYHRLWSDQVAAPERGARPSRGA